MSVRRLADDAVQPESFAFSRSNAAWAKKKIKDYPKGRQASAVIPLLMRAQDQEGWVSKPAIEHIAGMLDMPLIRVLEVATFYTQFQLQPVGTRAHIQVCGTTPCMLRGSDELIALCKKHIAERPFDVTADGTMSWEEVECQGACVNAPMVMIGHDTYEDLTPRQFEHILDRFGAGRGDMIEPGPQVDRIRSAPEGGLTSLTSDPTVKKSRARKTADDGAKGPPATEAGHPDSHADVANPAVKTPVSRRKAEKAQDIADRKSKPASDTASGRHEPGSTRIATAAKVAAADGGAPDHKPTSSAATGAAGAGAKGPTKAERPGLDSKDRPTQIERPAEPDDLKMINGVGPKIEGQLNELGIWQFAQVAAWKKAEREWVNGYLRFSGRIERDDWVRQAKALAKGGRDEYVRVFGKEPR